MTEKQAKFVKYLLGKRGYRTEDWSWLSVYSVKSTIKMIDMLLKGGIAADEFVHRLPAPVVRPRQAHLPLPPPRPREIPQAEVPPELTEFKRWAREIYQRGEQTIQQLAALQEARFGNPFA